MNYETVRSQLVPIIQAIVEEDYDALVKKLGRISPRGDDKDEAQVNNFRRDIYQFLYDNKMSKVRRLVRGEEYESAEIELIRLSHIAEEIEYPVSSEFCSLKLETKLKKANNLYRQAQKAQKENNYEDAWRLTNLARLEYREAGIDSPAEITSIFYEIKRAQDDWSWEYNDDENWIDF